MGPLTLFDKSFLQTLTLDEACLFDQFFSSNVCPMFMAEVLADLSKPAKGDQLPQRVVEALALKGPCMHSYPNVYHRQLIQAELAGEAVDMSGRPHVGGGQYARSPKGLHIAHDEPAEMAAFNRWQRGDFASVERDFAVGWRSALQELDLKAIAASLRDIKEQFGPIRSLADAKAAAATFINAADRQAAVLQTIGTNAGFGAVSMARIRERWTRAGRPSIRSFAPYATFVLEVDVFFELALMQSMISPDRASNRIDISYLYYLPFCQMFVSRDRLHERTASLFMRPSQRFVWGDELKADLNGLHDELMKLPEAIRETGLIKFAKTPPLQHTGKVGELWDHFMPKWREKKPTPPLSEANEKKLLAALRRGSEAPRIPMQQVTRRMRQTEPESMHFSRMVPVKRGSWYVLPKDIKTSGAR